MGGDEATLGFYTREAAAYADYAVIDEAEPHMAAFAAMLPQGGRVLDFGCGSGWAADHFRNLGFRVDGYDGSEGLRPIRARRDRGQVRRVCGRGHLRRHLGLVLPSA